jgi:hypothetical protein
MINISVGFHLVWYLVAITQIDGHSTQYMLPKRILFAALLLYVVLYRLFDACSSCHEMA